MESAVNNYIINQTIYNIVPLIRDGPAVNLVLITWGCELIHFF